ncbi:zinc finger and BTB domain containing 12 L homeolog isoform X1 [Xenopus laevis]|uniref:MGC79103 protein n=2 Tax=Xenopus laevis TaxID=8355 RepID=Q6IP05_XENLA|nr:zinc finger and BTB domain containing 12 L homeolog [Xenopus laevis]XP_018084336.1 zinc finger and BTB domain containing 12 L homeolog isoform X1 [Xenopus laevis]XP_018084337.1 zinc finger and BTB domain containing 12 L homeolog isoform X1 [Xenopus laevis]XP_018084338.1 zinc finger and BTB domain containing 12 L homeolog isoform X1 [Xenopus laevis]XP_041427930.1 zinc finger and BTB domain containing 12 L homeolog isoform X1 [Xenopus laevis]AAH72114.1 MGC79103 protein [Xenopus laevis]OCT678
MASFPDILRFQLPGHEAATLRSMNQLRSEERFCDVTVLSDGLKFRGHRVVLAACSPFLRDQFLLNPGSELQVSLMHGPRVVSDLLLSCYTGLLEFSVRDIVNYLTAASYLQMEHVVEKCRQALSQFIEPKIGLRDPSKAITSRGAPSTTSTTLHPVCSTENRRSLKTEIKADDELEEEMFLMAEEEEEDDEDEEGSSSDICIVKVESGMGGGTGKGGVLWRKRAEEKNLRAQSEEGLVNSTVEGSEPGESIMQQGGTMKAIYSDEVEGGEGVLIIPSSYHEEEDEEVFDGGASGCQSSVVVDGTSRNPLGDLGGVTGVEAMVIGDARLGNRRSVKCCKCEEIFQGVEKLVFHMRAQHFVFMCPRCGKQFNHSSNLNRHMNVHRGVKSHSCHICGKCFTQKSTLHDHLNLHSGERPYRCSYCDVRFAHKPAIRRHLKEQHGKTTAQNVLEAGVSDIKVLVT